MALTNLASNISEARKARNLSQQDLAEMIEVHQTYISQLERGLDVPTLKVIDRIADVLDCSVDTLLGRDRKNFWKEELKWTKTKSFSED